MFLAVRYGRLDIHDGIARHDTAFHGLVDAFFNTRDKASGYRLAEELVFKLIAYAPREGLDLEDNAGVLPMASRLFLVRIFGPRFFGDSFAVGDAGNPRFGYNLREILDLVENHVDLKIAHARDDRFLCLAIVFHLEGEVLFGRFKKKLIELSSSFLFDADIATR